MKRALAAILMVFTIAHAYACEPAAELLTKLRSGSFSDYVQGEATISELGLLNRGHDPVCVYGLTLVMSDHHGATRLLVTNSTGVLRATYMLTLAEFIGLKGTTVLVQNSRGQMEAIDLGEGELPAKVFFDGELSDLFLPN